MRPWLFSLLVIGALGCSPVCPPSADIQVRVTPMAGVAVGMISRLQIALSVDGGAARSLSVPLAHPLVVGQTSAFLLRPDPAPSSSYHVDVTVQALAADDAMVALATTSGAVATNGCNRLEARLEAAAGPDGGLSDGSPATFDLAGCGPNGSHDEDADNLPDSCDPCPADADPMPVGDSDGDGLANACDPDPNKAGNRTLYYNSFEAGAAGWSGGFPVTNSFMSIDTAGGGALAAVETGGLMTGNVRAQTRIFVSAYYTGGSVDAGVMLVSATNPGGSQTSGMLCTINRSAGGAATVELNVLQNGALLAPTAMPMPQFLTGRFYVLRLVQRGTQYSCEAAVEAQPTIAPVSVSATGPAFPANGPQFLAFHAQNVEAHFHYAVAETTIP